MNKQKTLNGSFSLFGKGLHTGLSLTVTFNPAPENYGYKIQRIDLPGEPIIDAVAENVTETTRGTVLTKARHVSALLSTQWQHSLQWASTTALCR